MCLCMQCLIFQALLVHSLSQTERWRKMSHCCVVLYSMKDLHINSCIFFEGYYHTLLHYRRYFKCRFALRSACLGLLCFLYWVHEIYGVASRFQCRFRTSFLEYRLTALRLKWGCRVATVWSYKAQGQCKISEPNSGFKKKDSCVQ
jgi:hypothetical protein